MAVAVLGGGSSSASLCSQVPPSIRENGHRANVSGMAGQSLTLECDANGFPAPKVTWLKDGQQVGVPWGGWAVGGIWIGYTDLLDGFLHVPGVVGRCEKWQVSLGMHWDSGPWKTVGPR